jgi:hypothetical protein
VIHLSIARQLKSTAVLYSNAIDFHRAPVPSSAQIAASAGLGDRYARVSDDGVRTP